MGSYDQILYKLKGFTKKYYAKQLIKGSLLFIAFGLLFWIAIMAFEFLLWLNESWRLFLFLVFVIVEMVLVIRFIAIPLIFLFRLRRGLTYEDASKLIGRHFPNVEDKLLNLLDLANDQQESELLMASIEQRAKALGPVPFAEAVNIKESFKYAKYVVIPVFLLAFIWLSGNIASFFNSHERIVNYDMAYERPAPFQFAVLNDDLQVLDNEPLTIEVDVQGEVVPEDVYIVIDEEPLLMTNRNGIFSYTIAPPVAKGSFYLTANGWNSVKYGFRSLATPALLDFKMTLDYPKYLGRNQESVAGTGNAVVPEGTLVTWQIQGRNVEEIRLIEEDSSSLMVQDEKDFIGKRRIFGDLEYQLSTSNSYVKDFEKLSYFLEVVKDNKPTVKVQQFLDSLNPNQSFYSGQAADDHGVKQIRMVYYSVEDKDDKKQLLLESPGTNVHQFYYTFPSGLEVEKGKDYELYFEVVDNDGIRGGKTTRSKIFRTSLYNHKQLANRKLDVQNNLLKDLDRELENYKEQEEALTRINKEQKEENSLSFEDKGRIKQFLEKQEEQERLMEKFSSQLKDNLENSEENNEMKQLLKERLQRQEMEARKNERLLEELKELADKIEKEELQKRLEELGKKQSSTARNLEQILELTKRYYVTEKMAQLSKELDELSKEQQKLAETVLDESLKNQQELNEEFNNIVKELDELRNDNQNLKKPMNLDVTKNEEESVKKDQQEATKELSEAVDGDQENKEEAQKNASKRQKSAAEKMREMSEKMSDGASDAGGSSVTEDAEMLRQILDNLVTFSFKQEALFDRLEASDFEVCHFSNTVREQKELRNMFEHVDDSLFALSLRRAELSEFVNEQITEVYYNIDKSLETIAENQVYRGASYQQYAMNATNALADFLANILDNMQQSLKPGQGNGQGSDFQLPDIIQGQQGIQEKMNGAGQKGRDQGGQPEKGKGENQGQNDGQGEGTQGESEGQRGKEGGNQPNNQSEGNGSAGGNEMGLEEIYDIYKQQQFLRQQLEKQLEDMINKGDRDLARKLLRQMEDFENDLLENGITAQTRSKANTIQHQMLKLENATLKQGKKSKRESRTNEQKFTNPIITKPSLLREKQNSIEILNRQALPLRQNYKKKVKVYFDNDRIPL
ncbi:hypothetical protein GTQ34_07085 [Muricauda sp. JGD-17]|uniref:DUF4175 family protein n=1 Tax=Flagellimonas ochracea TaxID=2696472 RepID=A0A964TB81_9FLAO|nr:hypothetical protein [Allomuricauda ochracea]NAY91677.1 hypothetical protein [Allomuricauda ochracea]